MTDNLLRQLSLASPVSTLQKSRIFVHIYHSLVFGVIADKTEKYTNPRCGLEESKGPAGEMREESPFYPAKF